MRKPTEVERLYLDFDGFFASVEQQARPALRGRPVGVVPFEGSEHTCVIACSREAKAFRVKNIMPVRDPARMFPDGNVTDFLKHLDERAAAAREAGEARQADQADAPTAPEEPHPVAVENEVQELVREIVRELEVPAEIKNLPEWPATYEAAAADYGAMITSAAELDGPAFNEVPELEPGADVAGTVERMERIEDTMVYIVRDDDGVLTALHDDANNPQFPELEAGDAITASREQDGEYTVSYDHDYGL